MSSASLSSLGLEDLRPVSRGITIIPRSRSASRTSCQDTQRMNTLKSESGTTGFLFLPLIRYSVRFQIKKRKDLSQFRICSSSCLASSVQSVADESLSLVDIESMVLQKVKDRKDDLKAAFRAFDKEGSATVTKGEFRGVIEGFLLPLTHSQFDGLLAKVRSSLPFRIAM